MNDFDQVLELYREKSTHRVNVDFFLHYATQYENCLKVKNRKKFVITSSWLEQRTKNDIPQNFAEALSAMTSWYAEHYPVLNRDEKLTYENLYHYLPVLVNYLAEARRLWELLNGSPPASFEDQSDSFWRDLVPVVQRSLSHSDIVVSYLRLRYGGMPTKDFPVGNMPPNPFVERRTFSDRRGGRDRGDSRRGGRMRDDNRGSTRGSSSPRPFRERSSSAERREPVRRREERPRNEPREATSTTLTGEMNDEIRDATAILQANPDLQEKTLKPANSYYRRLQHKAVSELGFTSVSVGENREDRAVKIVRSASSR